MCRCCWLVAGAELAMQTHTAVRAIHQGRSTPPLLRLLSTLMQVCTKVLEFLEKQVRCAVLGGGRLARGRRRMRS